jgi:hypothetical protein
MERSTFARWAGLCTATLLGGCAVPPQVTTARDAAQDIAPRRLRGCSAWRETIAEGWAWEAASAWAGVGRTTWEGALDTAKGDADAGVPARSSQTNTQVAGVDEPDSVESDGGYMYVQGDMDRDGRHAVRVVDARDPYALAQVGRIALEGVPRGMLLAPGALGVLASADGGLVPWEEDAASPAGWPGAPATALDLVDVTVPQDLGGGARVEVDGELLDARRAGTTAWVVTRWRLDVPQAVWDAASGTLWPPDASVDRARGALYRALLPVAREAVRALPDESLLPEVRLVGARSGGVARRLACDAILAPRRPESVTLALVARVGMDPADPTVEVEGVVTGAHALWMDASTLLLAETSWARGGALSRLHRLGLAPHVSRRRAGHVLRSGASAEVPGMVLDRWSLDAWEGDVRVVTTEVGLPLPGRERAPGNRLAVLRADGSRLRTVGSIADITPGERLMAARFQGDRAFLVTYEVVDPLLAVDLSDPRDPRIAGVLEVPGYSAYLHPYGEDRLLAVGMDGTATGETTGFAVSLFDVADLSAPERLAVLPYESRWSSSPSLWDPHAFLVWEDVLAVPIVAWDPVGDRAWSGLSVVRVGADDTLAELGRIDHARLGCATPGVEGDPPACAWTDMRRALVVEGDLYAVSTAGVSAHPLRDPAVTLGEVAWDAGLWAR